jgi:hypothetical protein
MEFFTIIAQLRGDARIADLAQEIADQSIEAVRDRVDGRISALGMAEARGYIRARSAAVVRPAVEAILRSSSDLKPAWRSQLVEKATEEVVRRLLWEEMGRRREAAPQRRAA